MITSLADGERRRREREDNSQCDTALVCGGGIGYRPSWQRALGELYGSTSDWLYRQRRSCRCYITDALGSKQQIKQQTYDYRAIYSKIQRVRLEGDRSF